MPRKVDSKRDRNEVYCRKAITFSEADMLKLWALFGGAGPHESFKAIVEDIAAAYRRARKQDEDTATREAANKDLLAIAEAAREATNTQSVLALMRALKGLNHAAEFPLGVELMKRVKAFGSVAEALNAIAAAPLAHADVIANAARAAISTKRGPVDDVTLAVALDALVRLYETPATFGVEGIGDRLATHSLSWPGAGGSEPGSAAGRFLSAAFAVIDPQIPQTRIASFAANWVASRKHRAPPVQTI